MSRLSSAFKRFAAPIVVVLVVAAAAVIFLLTTHSTSANFQNPDSGNPQEVICGYDLRQDQSQCKSDPVFPVMPVSPQIPPTGGQPVICGYDLRQDQNHCISDPVFPVIPDTGSKTSPYVSVPIELERGYNLKENQSFFK